MIGSRIPWWLAGPRGRLFTGPEFGPPDARRAWADRAAGKPDSVTIESVRHATAGELQKLVLDAIKADIAAGLTPYGLTRDSSPTDLASKARAVAAAQIELRSQVDDDGDNHAI